MYVPSFCVYFYVPVREREEQIIKCQIYFFIYLALFSSTYYTVAVVQYAVYTLIISQMLFGIYMLLPPNDSYRSRDE